MTAKILVVDDLLPNIKLLQIKLSSEYYDVITATNGIDAIKLAKEKQPDIILLDVMMPDMDGYETCRLLKENPETTYIPVVMVTALDDTSENKINGLKSGADDFLTKPINDIALFARIRSLTRLKIIIDELRLRGKTNLDMKILENEIINYSNRISNARILLIDEDQVRSEQIYNTLQQHFQEIVVSHNPLQALEIGYNGSYDLIITDIHLTGIDGLRLCSLFRSKVETRYTPILVLFDEDNNMNLLIKAFDIGINDYVVVPIDINELIVRVNTQIKRKKYQDALRMKLDDNIEMAITDPLTGAYNRRYFDMHFKNMINESLIKNRKLSLMIIDIDFFKRVNDTFGHTVGDELLKQLNKKINDNIRVTDLLARFGGEEFVIILPDTTVQEAVVVAERIRESIAQTEFYISQKIIKSTVSIGVTEMQDSDDANEKLLIDRADQNLYKAKNQGRDKVVSS